MSDWDRRTFLRVGALTLVPAAMRSAQDSSVAPLWQPQMAGRPRARITDYENDPFVVDLEKRIRCTCGCNLDVYTCRTTDFTCTFSPERHREVVALVKEEKTAEEILAAFVSQHGESILMAPPKEGFNWAAYLLPGIVITLVGSVLGWVLVRRARHPAAVPVANSPQDSANLSRDDAERLRAELERLEV